MDLKQLAEDMVSVYTITSSPSTKKYTHKSGYTNTSGHYIGANPKKVAKRHKKNKNKKTHRRK